MLSKPNPVKSHLDEETSYLKDFDANINYIVNVLARCAGAWRGCASGQRYSRWTSSSPGYRCGGRRGTCSQVTSLPMAHNEWIWNPARIFYSSYFWVKYETTLSKHSRRRSERENQSSTFALSFKDSGTSQCFHEIQIAFQIHSLWAVLQQIVSLFWFPISNSKLVETLWWEKERAPSTAGSPPH